MKSKLTTLTLSVLLLFVLLGGPQMAMAQQSTSAATGTTQPPAPLPDAPSSQAQNAQAQPANAPAQASRQQQSDQTPLGAAAAQQGVTAGGAASRPAGNAIAPAKQRQVRSLLIKLGAVAAGAAAIGAIVALSRGTSSVPPGSGR
jgi:hypothetical protein